MAMPMMSLPTDGTAAHTARIGGAPPRDARAVRPRSAPDQNDTVPGARLRVLVVDDDAGLLNTCASLLRLRGYEVTVSSRGQEAFDLLRRWGFDIVLLDLHLPQVDGLALLRTALATRRDTIVIVMTDNPSLDSCIEALREGAWDYLPKPFSASHLQILVGRAAHLLSEARQAHALGSGQPEQATSGDVLTLVGAAPAFRRAIELARQVAQTDASVFITGESGTGKEVIAQFIHRQSRRAARAFVPVNCAALPEALLESEMFGHRKGAFTGAVREKPGLLEVAHEGTLFLDELIEMPKTIQAKVLRVLQDGIVRRVGSETTDAVVDVRFIAATNRDPEVAIAEGLLREDLYYRLRVVPLHLPPLRERAEDIPALAEYSLATFWSRHRGRQTAFPRFSDAALRAMCAYPWRGNIRELQNMIEHLAVVTEPGTVIQPQHLCLSADATSVPVSAQTVAPSGDPDPFVEVAPATAEAAPLQAVDTQLPIPEPLPPADPPAVEPPPPSATHSAANVVEANPASLVATLLEESYHAARDRVLHQFEIQYLMWLVTRAEGNLAEAARIAGVNRTTLYRMMVRNGLQRAPSLGWLTEVAPQDSVEPDEASATSPVSDA